MPPQLRVKRSIIIPRSDEVIYEKNTEAIREEILRQNYWIWEENDIEIYKFPRTSTIKITFTQTILAEKCLHTGVKAFSISIPSHQIKPETYVPVKCCMKCYALEQHFTNKCPKPKEFKVCSECSQQGHVCHQWENATKKCLNCDEEHSSLAMKCSKRKQIIKEKRNMTCHHHHKSDHALSHQCPHLPITTHNKGRHVENIHLCCSSWKCK